MDYTPTQVATAIMLYMHNKPPKQIIQKLFPDAHPNYFIEWFERLSKGFGPFFGHLDKDHREMFVTNALEAYGSEVRS